MFDKNPLQVQDAPASRRNRATPLVLIHDGGGTTFGYFSLGSLNRDVWAIHNPRYYSSESFEGGMDEMAQCYIGLMEEAGIRGRILLGGWSLGGYLSLAIARILADEPNSLMSVAGLLLIDSPYHVPLSQLPPEEGEPDFDNLPELVRKALDECDDLLVDWHLPSWDGPACEGKDAYIVAGNRNFSLHCGDVIHKPSTGDWRLIRSKEYQSDEPEHKAMVPPPAVLVKCNRPVPAKNEKDGCCRVDMYRDDVMLGWSGRYPNFIKAVLEVDADHYNIFGFAKIKQVTDRLNQGLGILETVETRKARPL
ncbi:alpha/beta-hydrolase [Myriangium duriaei CBS 260.36]|uniref:Alpha/beta-hydrolase n=1 Tax=Myriangium duriaei CBS 260.36 TaxID=1168546 RepID=A0A9P4MHE2_9PEZI|nr:alpha/beta-hydrolase [Myriangium duriaei CBS 260.36]